MDIYKTGTIFLMNVRKASVLKRENKSKKYKFNAMR